MELKMIMPMSQRSVTTQRILNKFLRLNFSVGWMVWPWSCLFQALTYSLGWAWIYLHLTLWKWGAGNVYLLELSIWKVKVTENPICCNRVVDTFKLDCMAAYHRWGTTWSITNHTIFQIWTFSKDLFYQLDLLGGSFKVGKQKSAFQIWLVYFLDKCWY